MIFGLLVLSLAGWAWWSLFGDECSSPRALTAQRTADGNTRVNGARESWTTLDEYQLIRLLSESSPKGHSNKWSTEISDSSADGKDMP